MPGKRAFTNCTVYLGEGASLKSGYVMVDGPTIREVGPLSGFDRRPGLEVIDLKGKLLLPGLTDCHLHLVGYAHALIRIDLADTASLQAGLERIRVFAQRLPKGGWLRGRGWDKQHWGMTGFPNRSMLDSVAPDNPVALWSRDGHNMWLNSMALESIGVGEGARPIEGGQIQLDKNGRPTGMLFENAAGLVPSQAGEEDLDTMAYALEQASDRLVGFGLTSVHSVESSHHASIMNSPASGCVKVGVFRMREVGDPDDLDDPALAGHCDCVKMYADGALGSQTASMLEPYCGQPGNIGITVTSGEHIYKVVSKAVGMGMPVAVHAIGDRANMVVLDVYERVRREQPANRTILRIEHVQVIRRVDIPRFASLGVVASMQPIHVVADREVARKYWGSRSRNAYLWRSIGQSGASVAFGSDAPIEDPDPLKGIHAAVTRREPGQPALPPWNHDECLTVGEAIDCYSLGAAAASGNRASGKVEPGSPADFTILDTDILAADDPDVILETGVAMTVVEGQIRYDA
jgi:predicted amidohydrolase YtcJ